MGRLTELIDFYNWNVEDLAMSWKITTKHMEGGERRQHREYCQRQEDTLNALKELQRYKDLEEQGRLIEVVRCSECEHHDTVGCADGCGWCDYWDIGRFTDGYCDKAKLKELEG